MAELLGLAIDVDERGPERGLRESLGLLDLGDARRRLDEGGKLAVDDREDFVGVVTTRGSDGEAE